MRHRLTPEQREVRRLQRLLYFKAYYRNNRKRKLLAAKAYYQGHKPEYRNNNKNWKRRHKQAIKVRTHLGVTLNEARRLLAAIPNRQPRLTP